MPKYKLNVTLSTTGTVIVEAENLHDAKEAVTHSFWGMLGEVGPSNDDTIKNWEFDLHLNKTIVEDL